MTLRAARLLGEAQVVVHDRLVSAQVLELCSPSARRIDVGKRRGHHRLPQTKINALLITLAREGMRVVRLKGGDPLVFARGGEEALALARAGVAFDIVPGVTAATACAASAGIPLTHRHISAGIHFVTGHAHDGIPDLDWDAIASSRDTLVVYMGLHALGDLLRRLRLHGLDPATPMAVVENGGCDEVRIARAAVVDFPAAADGLTGPAMVIVGDVVAVGDVIAAGMDVSGAVSASVLGGSIAA